MQLDGIFRGKARDGSDSQDKCDLSLQCAAIGGGLIEIVIEWDEMWRGLIEESLIELD